jgi:serine/threonine-protein kinase
VQQTSAGLRTLVRQAASQRGPGKDRASNLSDTLLDQRYEVGKRLGEGGMSYVYLAKDVTTSETVAIKVLTPKLSEDKSSVERLRREAGLAMRLDHPNVCRILRLGETEDGLIYLVMPYLAGELLSDREVRQGAVPLDVGMPLLVQMCRGLQHAHDLQIIHRDLKPENVMLVPDDKGPSGIRAVIMDFGLAKERRQEPEVAKLTATGIVLGTPEFMSPEQLRGKPLDPRTDVYSLALMTYEMLTGKLPFQGRTQQEMMIARLRSDPIPIRKMRPDFDIPESVEKVLNKAMSRSADDRYQTVLEFAEALEQAAGGENEESGLLGKLFGR